MKVEYTTPSNSYFLHLLYTAVKISSDEGIYSIYENKKKFAVIEANS